MTERAVDKSLKLADEVVSCAKELLGGKDEANITDVDSGKIITVKSGGDEGGILVVAYSHQIEDELIYLLIQDEWAFREGEIIRRISKSRIKYNSPDWRANGRVASYISTESETASEVSPEVLSTLLKTLKVSRASHP